MSGEWKNKPSISDLKADFDSANASHLRQIDRLDLYNEIYDETTPNEQKTFLKRLRSTYKSRLFKKMMEWVVPNIENPVLSKKTLFTLSPKSNSAITVLDKNASILNHQWNKEIGKVELVNKAVRNFAIEGTCVLKVGWKTETKIETVVQQQTVFTSDISEINSILEKASVNQELYTKLKQQYEATGMLPSGSIDVECEVETVIENRPYLTVRDNRAIIVDPSAKGVLDNVRFVIDIQETDYSTLSKNDSYFNLDYVKEYIKNKSGVGSNDYNLATYTDYDEDDLFEFSDLARKKITIYEYWGYWDINGDNNLVPIVASWVGNKLIRLEENPYPHQKIPYVFAQFNPLKDEIWGEPYATLLENDQKSLTATYRAMEDITNENAVGQEFIDDSIFKTPIQKENYEKGKTVYVNRGTDLSKAIMRKSVEPVPKVLFDMKGIYTEHSTLLTGIEDMDGGAGSRMTQSVTGAPMKVDAKTNREMEVLRRFLTMLENAGNLILSMNKEYLLDTAIYDTGSGYQEINDVDTLNDDFSVSVDVSTPTIDNDKASKIMFLMHNNGANMSPQLAALHYAKTAELWNMPDLAKTVLDEANRPPSEEQALAQQLELERLKLENKKAQIELLAKIKEMEFKDAKIEEIKESIIAGSQEARVIRDKSQAELALAQADKMDAQVRLFNQEFELVESGTKREWEKEDNEFHHLANLEREEVRTKREQENIKLKEEKKNKDDMTTKEKNLEYIRRGTLENDTYDAADDIFRNILDKNSIDTEQYKKDLPSMQRMPSVRQPMKDPDVKSTIAPEDMIGEDKPIDDTIK